MRGRVVDQKQHNTGYIPQPTPSSYQLSNPSLALGETHDPDPLLHPSGNADYLDLMQELYK